MRPTLLIGSKFHDDLIARISREVPEIEVVNRPDLLPVPQFGCDHIGTKRELDDNQLLEWKACLAKADYMLDFDWWSPAQWREHTPRLKWIQATQAGVAARALGFGHGDGEIQITTAAGVHAKPLAEFTLAGLLHFVRDIPHLEEAKENQQWTTGSSNTLFGKSALIVGAGSIGREVASLLTCFGVSCDGTNRNGSELGEPFQRTFALAECDLGSFDIVVLSCPLTEETNGLFSRDLISTMKQGAYIVNLARGQVVDQEALIEGLNSGRLAGAVLDVADPEPLPAEHPLWEAPNLILSPHSAANVNAENSRIVDLLIKNLRRQLFGEELINTFDPARGY